MLQNVSYIPMMIRQLSPRLKEKLRSGIAITSITQCVEELVLNSIDAGCLNVAVRVDMESWRVQVVDNGSGIQQSEMSSIAIRYNSSKCHTVSDLNQLSQFGYRGEALASIREVTQTLEVTSRHRDSKQTFCTTFSSGKQGPVLESHTQRPSYGTTITANDVFYNLPVRRKAMQSVLEIDRIRQRLEAIALIHPSVSISFRNDGSGQIELQTHRSKSILGAFTHIFGAEKSKEMANISYQSGKIKVQGFVGKCGHNKKNIQFIYINSRLVLKTKLHKLANKLISKYIIMNRKYDSPKPGQMDTVLERYGVFVINIICPLNSYDITFDPAKTHIEFHNWDDVTNALERAVNGMLERENLQPVNLKESNEISDIKDDENNRMNESHDVVCYPDKGKGIHTENIRNNLQSKRVHRFNANALEEFQTPEEVNCDSSDEQRITVDHISDTLSECHSPQDELESATQCPQSENICETMAQNERDTLVLCETAEDDLEDDIHDKPSHSAETARHFAETQATNTEDVIPLGQGHSSSNIPQYTQESMDSFDALGLGSYKTPNQRIIQSSLDTMDLHSIISPHGQDNVNESDEVEDEIVDAETEDDSIECVGYLSPPDTPMEVENTRPVETQIIPSYKQMILSNVEPINMNKQVRHSATKMRHSLQRHSLHRDSDKQKTQFDKHRRSKPSSKQAKHSNKVLKPRNGKSQENIQSLKIFTPRLKHVNSAKFTVDTKSQPQPSQMHSLGDFRKSKEQVKYIAGTSVEEGRIHHVKGLTPFLRIRERLSKSECHDQNRVSEFNKEAPVKTAKVNDERKTNRNEVEEVENITNSSQPSYNKIRSNRFRIGSGKRVSRISKSSQKYCNDTTSGIDKGDSTVQNCDDHVVSRRKSSLMDSECDILNQPSENSNENEHEFDVRNRSKKVHVENYISGLENQCIINKPALQHLRPITDLHNTLLKEAAAAPNSYYDYKQSKRSQRQEHNNDQTKEKRRKILTNESFFQTAQDMNFEEAMYNLTKLKKLPSHPETHKLLADHFQKWPVINQPYPTMVCVTRNNPDPIISTITNLKTLIEESDKTETQSPEHHNKVLNCHTELKHDEPNRDDQKSFHQSSSQAIFNTSSPCNMTDQEIDITKNFFTLVQKNPRRETLQKLDKVLHQNHSDRNDLLNIEGTAPFQFIHEDLGCETANTRSVIADIIDINVPQNKPADGFIRTDLEGRVRSEERQNILQTKSVGRKDPLQNKSIEIQEPQRLNSMERQEVPKSKSGERQEPLWTRLEERKELSRSKPVERQESLSQTSTERHESPRSKSGVGQVPPSSKSQEFPRSKSFEGQESLRSKSMERHESPRSQSSERQELLSSKSVERREHTRSKSFERQESTRSKSMERHDSPRTKSVERQELPSSESIKRQKHPRSKSVDRQEYLRSKSMERHESPGSKSLERQELLSSKSVESQKHQSSKSVERQEYLKSNSPERHEAPRSKLGEIKVPPRPKSVEKHEFPISRSGERLKPLWSESIERHEPPQTKSGETQKPSEIISRERQELHLPFEIYLSPPIQATQEFSFIAFPNEQTTQGFYTEEHEIVNDGGSPGYQGQQVKANKVTENLQQSHLYEQDHQPIKQLQNKNTNKCAEVIKAKNVSEESFDIVNNTDDTADVSSPPSPVVIGASQSHGTWVCQLEAKTGRTMYVNLVTGHSSYERPLFPRQTCSSSEQPLFSIVENKATQRLLTHNAVEFQPRSKLERGLEKKIQDDKINIKLDCPRESNVTRCADNIVGEKDTTTIEDSNVADQEDTNEVTDDRSENGSLSVSPGPQCIRSMLDEHIAETREPDTTKWRSDPAMNSAVQDLMLKWENPVFKIPEQKVLSAHIQDLSRPNTRTLSTLQPVKFTKSIFSNLKVLGQLDCKFILCVASESGAVTREKELVVIIDQHAAHERVRLEDLIAGAYEETEGCRQARSSKVDPPLYMHFTPRDITLLNSYKSNMESIGIRYHSIKKGDAGIEICGLPVCIQETGVSKERLHGIITDQLEVLTETQGAQGNLPKCISDILNSQACHGAIKFGDTLSLAECKELVDQLSECSLPFQCAHGRPSMIPLLDLTHATNTLTLKAHKRHMMKPNIQRLRRLMESGVTRSE